MSWGDDDERKVEVEEGTYDIDTAVTGNGNDGIKSAEIDTWTSIVSVSSLVLDRDRRRV